MIYNTKQKKDILDALKSEDKPFTIKVLYYKLNGRIGLTTIYRFINKLISDGLVEVTTDKKNVTYYQYLEKCKNQNHFYLKCDNCGSMIHTDCDCIEELKYHIDKIHNFSLSENHIIINGLCEKCRKDEKCENL